MRTFLVIYHDNTNVMSLKKDEVDIEGPVNQKSIIKELNKYRNYYDELDESNVLSWSLIENDDLEHSN